MCSGSGPLEADQLFSSEHKDMFLVCFLSMLCIHTNQDGSLPLFSCCKVLALNWGKPEAKLSSVVLTQEKVCKTTVHIGISRGLSQRKREEKAVDLFLQQIISRNKSINQKSSFISLLLLWSFLLIAHVSGILRFFKVKFIQDTMEEEAGTLNKWIKQQ